MKVDRKYCLKCGNVNKEASLHFFPKNETIRKKWSDFCGISINEIKKSHRLCNRHFTSSCLQKAKDRTTLKIDSVPTILIEKKSLMNNTRYSCVLCGAGYLQNGLTYHSFPKNEALRLKWATFCGMLLEHVKEGHKLCSKHFTPDCFDKRTRRLVVNSIPSKFNPTKDCQMEVCNQVAKSIFITSPSIQNSSVQKNNDKLQSEHIMTLTAM